MFFFRFVLIFFFFFLRKLWVSKFQEMHTASKYPCWLKYLFLLCLSPLFPLSSSILSLSIFLSYIFISLFFGWSLLNYYLLTLPFSLLFSRSNQSVPLSFHLSLSLILSLSTSLSVYISLPTSVYPSLRFSLSTSASLSVPPFLSLSTSDSISLCWLVEGNYSDIWQRWVVAHRM